MRIQECNNALVPIPYTDRHIDPVLFIHDVFAGGGFITSVKPVQVDPYNYVISVRWPQGPGSLYLSTHDIAPDPADESHA